MRQLLADAIGKPVVATGAEEPVLLGAAMLGDVAAGAFVDVGAAMAGMSQTRTTFEPQRGAIAALHQSRFQAFEELPRLARQLRQSRAV